MSHLIANLPWPKPARVRALMQPLAVTLAELTLVPIEPPAETDDEAERFSRCGWFDSSLELARGLKVIEYVDRLPDELAIDGLLWPAAGA